MSLLNEYLIAGACAAIFLARLVYFKGTRQGRRKKTIRRVEKDLMRLEIGPAIQKLESYIRQHGEDFDMRMLLNELVTDRSDLWDYCERTLSISPNDPYALYYSGLLFLEAGDEDEAERRLYEAGCQAKNRKDKSILQAANDAFDKYFSTDDILP